MRKLRHDSDVKKIIITSNDRGFLIQMDYKDNKSAVFLSSDYQLFIAFDAIRRQMVQGPFDIGATK